MLVVLVGMLLVVAEALVVEVVLVDHQHIQEVQAVAD
jgi:hypothetical protein